MKRIGILIADEYEFDPFYDFAKCEFVFLKDEKSSNRRFVKFNFNDKIEVCALECGVGKVNAAMSATELILSDRAEIILNAGLSGAVDALSRNDVVAGESYVECDFDISAFGYRRGEKTDKTFIHHADKELLSKASEIDGVKLAKLGTGDFFMNDTNKKEEYKKEFRINAFDMETAAIAAVCDRYEIPFLSFRKISDDSDNAVNEYSEMNSKKEADLTNVLFEFLKLL